MSEEGPERSARVNVKRFVNIVEQSRRTQRNIRLRLKVDRPSFLRHVRIEVFTRNEASRVFGKYTADLHSDFQGVPAVLFDAFRDVEADIKTEDKILTTNVRGQIYS
jgi:hypothetical protein